MGDIYFFSKNHSDGDLSLANILGNKGANLSEMSKLGLNVPPGFIISSEYCFLSGDADDSQWVDLSFAVRSFLSKLEDVTGKKFGGNDAPLLLSVRSGSTVSMPGMMDTVLNIGINENIVASLSEIVSPKFAYDTHRRFIQLYGSIVMGVDSSFFTDILEQEKLALSVDHECYLPVASLANLRDSFLSLVRDRTGMDVPSDPYEQLFSSIRAVFKSWMGQRAVCYRKLNGISDNIGTAVNVQSMVFGNLNAYSGTGVVFTRDPSSGKKELFGEFMSCAQGEDIVGGSNTPGSVSSDGSGRALEDVLPVVYKSLRLVCEELEKHYRNMQDIEFTVEDGVLWILQTRRGKRSALADLVIMHDLVNEGVISTSDAVFGLDVYGSTNLMHPVLDSGSHHGDLIGLGLPASPGAASGIVAFDNTEVQQLSKSGVSIIMFRMETDPEDIAGMSMASGVVTARGGMTSHAAVVTRGMGKPCICGVVGMNISSDGEYFLFRDSGIKIVRGMVVTINGSTGELIMGHVPTVSPTLPVGFSEFLCWIKSYQSVGVLANADTPEDAKIAINLGAGGIGLCRTEHMFFSGSRILLVQRMVILSDSQEERERVLAELEKVQSRDFYDIFSVMKELPVTIRFLDPPLHEFLPSSGEAIASLSDSTGLSYNVIERRIAAMSEKNPMLGTRGCRIAVLYPEIYQAQARAVFKAVEMIREDLGITVVPEIMIPLVFNVAELKFISGKIREVAETFNLRYKFGTMIELPSAAMIAGELAEIVDFCSFGTNDLTQTTLGISRDDAHEFLITYQEIGILGFDPFVTLDASVIELMNIAIARAKAVNPDIKFGICGEHAGDLKSIELLFQNDVDVDYVSCSPYRAFSAGLAIAQFGHRHSKVGSCASKELIS